MTYSIVNVFFFKINFDKTLSDNIFGQTEHHLNLKLLISILSLTFLLTTISVTFFTVSDRDHISLTEEEASTGQQETKENQKEDIFETELTACLNNSFHILPTTLKKQDFIFFLKAYLPPYKTYDNPPPECNSVLV